MLGAAVTAHVLERLRDDVDERVAHVGRQLVERPGPGELDGESRSPAEADDRRLDLRPERRVEVLARRERLGEPPQPLLQLDRDIVQRLDGVDQLRGRPAGGDLVAQAAHVADEKGGVLERAVVEVEAEFDEVALPSRVFSRRLVACCGHRGSIVARAAGPVNGLAARGGRHGVGDPSTRRRHGAAGAPRRCTAGSRRSAGGRPGARVPRGCAAAGRPGRPRRRSCAR